MQTPLLRLEAGFASSNYVQRRNNGFSENNHVKVDIGRGNDGEPPTNHIQTGKLPQKRIDNMVSNNKQQANEKAAAAKAAKAKAKAAAAKAADERGIAGNRNQDISMLDGNQGDITTSESVGSKRKAITPQENIGNEGTQTSITHVGIDRNDSTHYGGKCRKANRDTIVSIGG
jgi:hypothetical protein